MTDVAVCILQSLNMSTALPLSFPVVARPLAALRLGDFALELEFFVLLGTTSRVLRLGLPLFLL